MSQQTWDKTAVQVLTDGDGFPFPDPRDAQIAALRAEVVTLRQQLNDAYNGLPPEGKVVIGDGIRPLKVVK